MRVSATPEVLWFLDALVRIHVSGATNADGISVIEHVKPYGSSQPLHIHHSEDEIFHVLSGEARFVLDGREINVTAGQTLLAPRGKPHTFVVTSKAGATWLTITRGYFERMLRVLARPAERDELPAAAPPTPEQVAVLEAACRANDIEIVGPPLPVPV
jgi:mannose-6-phosphate isomerase-like protein (cupin superfamily)